MTGLLSDLRFRVGACVAALAGVAAIGAMVSTPAPPESEGSGGIQQVVVNRAAVGCPALGSADGSRTVVDAVSPLLPDGTPTAGGKTSSVELHRLWQSSRTLLETVGRRGHLVTVDEKAEPVPVAVRAVGPLAAGTTATTTSSARKGVNRGMASTQCTTPSAEFWFAGASTAPGRRDVLVMTNLDDVNASVDITYYGPDGELDNTSGRGIVIRGKGQTEVFLNTSVPRVRDLALHVLSTGGRVAAALRDNSSNTTSPTGVDWLPPAAEPGKEVVVPAIAGGAGARVLTVMNPGDLPTTATIAILGRTGRFRPAGRDTLYVPAGGVRTIRLDTPQKKGDPPVPAAAVAVSAEVPVTASVRIVDERNQDFAVVGSAVPLTGPAYLVLPVHTEPMALIVSAPGEGGSAVFEIRSAGGAVVQSRTIKVASGATAALQLATATTATYLTVSPDDGSRLVAGVMLTPPSKMTEFRQVASWPLSTSQVFRAQTGTQPDIRAALR